jgi:hypothetical protein
MALRPFVAITAHRLGKSSVAGVRRRADRIPWRNDQACSPKKPATTTMTTTTPMM